MIKRKKSVEIRHSDPSVLHINKGEQGDSETSQIKFIRFPAVQELTGGCSRTTVWRWMRDGIFPKSYRIGPNICAWDLNSVLEWAKTKARKAPEIERGAR